eukprot:CAMPEP_0117588456 /NCGR_PEP_ID=MMETSP0784-20121206/69862_1 /TAXON_ID=39447 /ORGANISM="" /LENGTH=176 /DNA_ID=CAMNT_0005389819 /DNA_START=36 /DNA_END=563 /DNA_ORIENTATION=+
MNPPVLDFARGGVHVSRVRATHPDLRQLPENGWKTITSPSSGLHSAAEHTHTHKGFGPFESDEHFARRLQFGAAWQPEELVELGDDQGFCHLESDERLACGLHFKAGIPPQNGRPVVQRPTHWRQWAAEVRDAGMAAVAGSAHALAGQAPAPQPGDTSMADVALARRLQDEADAEA